MITLEARRASGQNACVGHDSGTEGMRRIRWFTRRSTVALLLLFPPAVAGTSCGQCDNKSCREPGVYIAVGLQPEAATAKICIDADCRTLSVEAHPGLTGS